MKNKLYLIVAFGLAICAANAATKYVAPYGNDANNGTLTNAANAWKTYGYAFSNAAAGDTIQLLEGTYAEKRMNIGKANGWKSGPNASTPSRFENYPGHTVILAPLDQSGTDGSYAIRWSEFGTGAITKSNQVISGITIDLSDFDATDQYNHGGIHAGRGLNLTVTNCVFRNLPCGYLFLGMGQANQALSVVTNAHIVDCLFTNFQYLSVVKTDGQPHAVYTAGLKDSTLERLLIVTTQEELGVDATAGKGAALVVTDKDSYGSHVGGTTIRNVHVRTTGKAAHIGTIGNSTTKIYNCTFYTSSTLPTDYCFYVWGPGNNAQIDHNTIYGGARGIDLHYYGNIAGSMFRNNIIKGIGSGTAIVNNASQTDAVWFTNNIINGWTTTLTDGASPAKVSLYGTIPSDPLLTSSSDFHILAASPARNTGLTLASITTDFDGDARPTEGVSDIGADEYTSGGTTPTVSVTGDVNCYEGIDGSPVPGSFTLSRSLDGTNTTTSVVFALTGTATGGGTHYSASATTGINMGPGTVTTNIVVTPVNNAIIDGSLTIILTVSADASYTVGSPSTATMTRIDDEQQTVYQK